MSALRVLVTGPVEGLAQYAEAAGEAGWDAVPFPLIGIEPRGFERADLPPGPLDLVAVTSANALPWLAEACEAEPELLRVHAAVVGGRTAQRVLALGFELALPHARDAEELAAAIAVSRASPARILWPRGSLSEALGRELAARGHEIVAPLAYHSRRLEAPAPAPCDAILFASPSAVRAFAAIGAVNDSDARGGTATRRCTAIAIGASTLGALERETALSFSATISLPEPTPGAFAFVLAHLDPRRNP